MNEDRKKRYGKAIWDASRGDEGTISATGANVVAAAVMAVADAEQEELCAELERYKRGGAELGKVIDRWGWAIIDATNSRDLVDETGDGDWEIIEERLAALGRAEVSR